ncbi:MAG: hypothetical protein GXY37_03555 [Chloroflexi bacterium]|nr:hypothetical protein [Chloroflexota bacterium]
MKQKRSKVILIGSVIILIAAGIVSFNYLDQKLVKIHQHFLYCQLITLEMSPNDTIGILNSVRSSDYVYNENLQEVWGNFSDPMIKHLFGGPARLSFSNQKYVATSIAVEGSTWLPVKCQ